ncbi:hypothetical protein OEZ85_014161 [Tetradesmus obliquus]|uniref:PAP-associated domain-containing protein n=1 Tax=Tetradesmus obliquus TaxID=3088 RepID=A0ABY8U7D1_TETOB|nr:hypothetical protein OEZ85_014161 [Tetradesmus obliquus]
MAGQKRGTPSLPPPIRLDLSDLDARLMQLVQQLAPSAEQRARQQQAWAAVQGLLQALWPQAGVHLFGSAANELDIGGSNDLDVCLELEGVEETKEARGEIISQLGEQLEQAGMLNVFAIPRARMPVVKFEHPETGYQVDITVNNRLAVVNTKLLRDYAAIDPRLRSLVLLVKHWAKRRRCNDAYVGTLSSYAYVLMCISHLQARSPPVLPVLQEMEPTHRRTIGNWCCGFCDDTSALAGFGRGNGESVAALLACFFYYWAHQHDFRRGVVTVRQSSAMTKAMKGWTTRVGLERHLFCIEDPFELSHDLGRTVHAEGCDKLRHEFRRAWDVLRHAGSSSQALQELLAEAPAPPPAPPSAGGGAGQAGTPRARAAAAAVGRDGQQPGTPGGDSAGGGAGQAGTPRARAAAAAAVGRDGQQPGTPGGDSAGEAVLAALDLGADFGNEGGAGQAGTPRARAAAAAAAAGRDGQQLGTPGGDSAGEAVLAALDLGAGFGNGV